MDSNRSVRALLLLSGGLDSQVAACLLRDQGIDVQGVVFTSPFFDGRPALEAARNLDIPVEQVMVHELLLGATVAGMMGVAVDLRLLFGLALLVVASVAAAAFPL